MSSELPPVLLVHGLGSSFEHNWQRSSWVDVLRFEDRTAIGFDLPGHGTSTAPIDGAAARAALEELLNEVGTVDAVGFSAGAVLLAGVAVTRPGAFRRLALLGAGDGWWRGDPSAAEPLASALETGADVVDPGLRVFQRLARSAGNDPARVAAYLRAAPPPPSPEELGAVDSPPLVLLGGRDPVGPADRLAAALPRARVVVLPGVDHMATTTDVRSQEQVVRFLAGDDEVGTPGRPAC